MSFLPLLFVGLGVVLLLAAWAVWHQGRRIRECVRDLMALPDDGHLMDWPQQASKPARCCGVRASVAWPGKANGLVTRCKASGATPPTPTGRG